MWMACDIDLRRLSIRWGAVTYDQGVEGGKGRPGGGPPPRVDVDDEWNLSISVRSGEDTNGDSMISGERSRTSPPRSTRCEVKGERVEKTGMRPGPWRVEVPWEPKALRQESPCLRVQGEEEVVSF